MLDQAQALQAAGCFAIVLECIPGPIAAAITASLKIPTIGIGAGPSCSGQVLVYHDLLGMMSHPHHAKVTPKFCKQYAQVRRAWCPAAGQPLAVACPAARAMSGGRSTHHAGGDAVVPAVWPGVGAVLGSRAVPDAALATWDHTLCTVPSPHAWQLISHFVYRTIPTCLAPGCDT